MQQNMMNANVVSQGERAGSSPNSNYDVRNVSNNLIVDKKYAGNHAELRYWFHNMMMTVEEGKGPKPAPAKAGQASISVGFRSKALGPLCMTDQYVAWDESTGKSVFHADSVGCPLCCLCKGYVADLNISPDPNDKENSSHIYFCHGPRLSHSLQVDSLLLLLLHNAANALPPVQLPFMQGPRDVCMLHLPLLWCARLHEHVLQPRLLCHPPQSLSRMAFQSVEAAGIVSSVTLCT